VTADNYIKAEIVSFAASEAGPAAGIEQMLAIACVLFNRRKKGWHGGNWVQILNHAGDVSALEPHPRKIADLASPPIRRLLQQVDDIYTGMFNDDLTGVPMAKDPITGSVRAGQVGGLYFLDAMWQERGETLRPWFQEKILGDQANHPRIAQVGMLYIFS
jgi:hypothetical protein